MHAIPPRTMNDAARWAAMLRKEMIHDHAACFSCLVAGVKRVIADRDRDWEQAFESTVDKGDRRPRPPRAGGEG